MKTNVIHKPYGTEIKKYLDNEIFFIQGQDSYLKEDIIKQICQNSQESEIISFFGEESKIDVILSEIYTNSIFFSQKIIILKNVASLENKDMLLPYIDNPLPEVKLILCSSEVDLRRKFFAKLSEKAVNFICDNPKKYSEIFDFIRKIAQEKKMKIKLPDLQIFSLSLKKDYQFIFLEMEKLFLYSLNNSQNINLSTIKEISFSNKDFNIYDLQEFLGQKDFAKAVSLYENMSETEDVFMVTLAILQRFFTLLWKIVSLKDSYSDNDIATLHLKEIPYYFREKYLISANKFKRTHLHNIFKELLETEVMFKSIVLNDKLKNLLMEKLFFEICRG